MAPAAACTTTRAWRPTLTAGLVVCSRCCPSRGRKARQPAGACRVCLPRSRHITGGCRAPGAPIRMLAIGELTICGIGVSRGDETATAATARALARLTRRPVAWRAHGLSGATARDGLQRLLPRIASKPVDLLIIAFCVNDVTAYRSPAAFADDLAAIVTAARRRVGDAAAVIGGVAPLASFPALPWPLRTILGRARPHCGRQPSNSQSAYQGSSWNDFQLRLSRIRSPPTASTRIRKRTSCGAKRLRRWRSR